MAGVSWNVRSIAEDSEWWVGSACKPRKKLKKKKKKINPVKTQEPRRGCESCKGELVLENGSGARERPKVTTERNTRSST